MIKLSFKKPYLVFVIVVAVLAGVLIPRMPVDILPQFKKSAALIRLLDLDPSLSLVAVDTILAPIHLESINLSTSFETAYQNRPELKSMELSLQSLNTEKKTTTTGLGLPELRIGTYGAYFGHVFSPLDPTDEINASLIWKFPLGRIADKDDLNQFDAKISLQENQLAQAKARVNQEILASQQNISIGKEQLVIALEGSELAEEALQQCLQRQQLGTVRPLEIIQAQEIYRQARLYNLQAVAAINKAQYSWFVAIGNNH